MGIASIYVADTHYTAGRDGPANAARQVVYLLGALLLAGVVLRVGYHAIARYAYVIFFAATLTLVPLFAARLLNTTMGGLTQPRNGAYRWIQLPGFQAQPSEFVKIAAVLALAWYLRYRKNYRRFLGLLVPFLIAAVPLGLILVQPDLGTVVLMIPVVLMMLFMAGAKKRHLALIALMGLAAFPLLWGQIKGYQRARITAVLLQSDWLRREVIRNPEKYEGFTTKRQALEWAASSGYQLVHSKNAIGSGGVTGHGWGEGVYVEQSLLPDRHNDFVFALIGHQWGFAGCMLVVVCYAVMVIAGARIASATPEPSGRLIAVGLTSLIGFQATINMAMSVGIMPTTGMTLPFVSHGGSSLLSGFVALALLISISRHRPFSLATTPFEFTARDTFPIHPAEQQRSSIPGEVAPWSPTRGRSAQGPTGMTTPKVNTQ
jgi:rod shape determining protein RodA